MGQIGESFFLDKFPVHFGPRFDPFFTNLAQFEAKAELPAICQQLAYMVIV